MRRTIGNLIWLQQPMKFDMFIIDSSEEIEEGEFEIANHWASIGDYFTRPDYRFFS